MLADGFARDDLARFLDQQQKQLEWLLLELDALALAKKPGCFGEDFEEAKAIAGIIAGWAIHA